MSDVTVKAVVDKREQKRFLNLPWVLHRSDPHWTPPLRRNQEELVGFRSHAFYEQGESQAFLAIKDGEVCGRISAIIYPEHNRQYQEKRGFFGFFESIDDTDVSRALFQAAENWLAEQGMTTIRGPANPSLHYEWGLLVDGFYEPAWFLMTYNPSYYQRLVEDYGFYKTQDMYAFWGEKEMLGTVDKKLEWVTREARKRFNVKLRHFNLANFQQEVHTFLNIYNQASGAMWGYVPMSGMEAEHMAKTLKHLLVPELTCIAEVDGKPIGAIFGMLDYNPRIKQIDGRLFPFGFVRLLYKRQKIGRMRFIATDVLPEFQRWGIPMVMLNWLQPHVLNYGIEQAEFSWVLESNDLSRKTLQKGGAKLTKTYRLYDYDIPKR